MDLMVGNVARRQGIKCTPLTGAICQPKFQKLSKLLKKASTTTAGAYHLLTIVRVFKPHLSCFTLFTTTAATTSVAAIKRLNASGNKCEHGLSPSSTTTSGSGSASGAEVSVVLHTLNPSRLVGGCSTVTDGDVLRHLVLHGLVWGELTVGAYHSLTIVHIVIAASKPEKP
jgi:hypothetical protein